MPLLTPCPVPGVINLCCSSQSGTGGWMPNGKKSASRQLSAKWSAVDSYKHPAAPPAVNRAGTKPCCSLWKCSTKKATGKAALAPLQRCGTVPAALPMHPDCTGSSTLQEGCWGVGQVPVHGQGLHCQLQVPQWSCQRSCWGVLCQKARTESRHHAAFHSSSGSCKAEWCFCGQVWDISDGNLLWGWVWAHMEAMDTA